YYHYDRPLQYDHVNEKDFPELMTKKFENQTRHNFGLSDSPILAEYSKFRKDVPADFTDMVKNLRRTPIKLLIEQKKKYYIISLIDL
ncbi:MAG: hypothetical protein ACRC1D_08870, partial [Culicoidibacterales bacterium]